MRRGRASLWLTAIKLRRVTFPFDQGELREIFRFQPLKPPPCPPWLKGGILNLMALSLWLGWCYGLRRPTR